MTRCLTRMIIFLTTTCAMAGNVPIRDYSFLYQDLPFAMDKVQQPSFPELQVCITEYGAKCDGVTSSTQAIAAAIDAVAQKGGGTVLIPEGLWITGPIQLKSNIHLHAAKGAIVLFTNNFDEFPLVKTWFEGSFMWRTMSPIYAEKAENIAITGEGVFDGNGQYWRPAGKRITPARVWNQITSHGGVLTSNGEAWYPTEGALKGRSLGHERTTLTQEEAEEVKAYLRPVMVGLVDCKRVMLKDCTFQNPPAWTIHPVLCQEVTIDSVKVFNEPWMANADALDLESCKNTIIYNCLFDAGDDAITIKSGRDEEGRKRGVPTENAIISKCTVYSGHGGFVVGSEMSGGVRNISVTHCSFMGTDNGLRFKSTRGRGGVVENIYISDIYMKDIGLYAILYNLYYGQKEKGTMQPINEGTPQFKNISMKNILCKGAGRGMLLRGLPEMPLENIRLENITVEAQTGIVCNDAKSITMKNVCMRTADATVLGITDSTQLTFDQFSFNEMETKTISISGEGTQDVVFLNSDIPSKLVQIDESVKSDEVTFK